MHCTARPHTSRRWRRLSAPFLALAVAGLIIDAAGAQPRPEKPPPPITVPGPGLPAGVVRDTIGPLEGRVAPSLPRREPVPGYVCLWIDSAGRHGACQTREPLGAPCTCLVRISGEPGAPRRERTREHIAKSGKVVEQR